MRLPGFKGEQFVLQYEAGQVSFAIEGTDTLVVTTPTEQQFGGTGRYTFNELTEGFEWKCLALGHAHQVEEPQLSIFRTEFAKLRG